MTMDVQIAEIRDHVGESSARILVSLGFNCFSWRPVFRDGPREMLWAEPGFEQGDRRPSSSGNPLLFPFAGRIRGAVYTFEGREYRLQPGDAFGNAIHGFVLNRPWRVVEHDSARVVGEFQASVDDPKILEHWPSDFRIQVSYEIRGRRLRSDIRYENTGARAMPCGFGTHAYFRLPLAEGGTVGDTVITAPVDHYWELERMVPTGRILAARPDHSLACGMHLVDHQFDTAFTNMRPDADGLVRTQVADPLSGRTLTQTFDRSFTQCVIYTPGHRQAICLEPYTCVPDAIRLAAAGHATGLQVLAPDEAFDTTIDLEVNE
jgi:aldose 1-epimerase